MSTFDREENAIYEAYERGDISIADMNEELRQLERNYRDEADMAAWEAYDRERENW